MGEFADDLKHDTSCRVGQVIRVSVETVKIVNALPAEFSDAAPPKASEA